MKAEMDHIGYAVKDMDAAIAVFGQLGYIFGEPVTDEVRNVRAVMGKLGKTKVELLMPIFGGYKVSNRQLPEKNRKYTLSFML